MSVGAADVVTMVRTFSAVVQETVRATVEAYAAGDITFPRAKGRMDDSPVSKDTKKSLIRYAPSFSAGISGDGPDPAIAGDYPYTAQVLAEFLGWEEPSFIPGDSGHVAESARHGGNDPKALCPLVYSG